MVSRSHQIEVLCPECQAPNPFIQWEVVDADENPSLVERILDGALFDFTCTNCEQEITLDFAIRLEDHAGHSIVQYDAPRAPKLALPLTPGNGYRLRRVTDQNALIELARIWKDSLDDGVMLLVKHLLAGEIERQAGSRPLICSYLGRPPMDGEEDLLEFSVQVREEDEPRVFTVSRPLLYERLKESLAEKMDRIIPKGQWIDWNAETAQRMYEAMESPPSLY